MDAGSITQDADEMTRFISFHIRSNNMPIDSYPVPVHPTIRTRLIDLAKDLSDLSSSNAKLIGDIHNVIWDFLQHPSDEFKKNDLFCPLSRYLVAVHIEMPYGRFSMPRYIPPTLSRLQWSFRATACFEIINVRDQYENQANKQVTVHL